MRIQDPSRHILKLICSLCKRVDNVRVNNPAIYTDEVRSKYMCWKCKKPKIGGEENE